MAKVASKRNTMRWINDGVTDISSTTPESAIIW